MKNKKAKNSLVIANWKMNLSFKKTLELTKDIKKRLSQKRIKGVKVVLCPSFPMLNEVKKIIKNSKIVLGAQDTFWEEKGPFTSAVSPLILKEIGCQYVIIGHSERRRYFKETDDIVHKKVKAALRAGLIPVICVGETFSERKEHRKDYVIIRQVSRALEGIKVKKENKVVIAYEPVWVIGSGQAVRPEEAEYTSKVILHRLFDLYSKKIVENNFWIIYGGSVDSHIVKSFTHQLDIEGVLVGGKSLRAKEFVNIVNQVAQ